MKTLLMEPLSPVATFGSLLTLLILMMIGGTLMRAGLDANILVDQHGGEGIFYLWGVSMAVLLCEFARFTLRNPRLR